AAGVVGGKLLRQLAGESVDSQLRLAQADAGLEAGDGVGEEGPALIKPLRQNAAQQLLMHRQRHVDIGSAEGVEGLESRGRNSDDGVVQAIEIDRGAHLGCAGAEFALPKIVAQDRDWMRARRAILVGKEIAAGSDALPQQGKEI